MQMGVCYVGVS